MPSGCDDTRASQMREPGQEVGSQPQDSFAGATLEKLATTSPYPQPQEEGLLQTVILAVHLSPAS